MRGCGRISKRRSDNTQLLDGDGDGLPDHDTRANTYDAWAMQGTPAYIASLWLAALKAAVRMAQDLGVQDRAAAWEALLEKGSKAFVEKPLERQIFQSLGGR